MTVLLQSSCMSTALMSGNTDETLFATRGGTLTSTQTSKSVVAAPPPAPTAIAPAVPPLSQTELSSLRAYLQRAVHVRDTSDNASALDDGELPEAEEDAGPSIVPPADAAALLSLLDILGHGQPDALDGPALRLLTAIQVRSAYSAN